MTDLCRLSAGNIAAKIRTKETTAAEVMAAHLDRIALREPMVQAFEYLDYDAAMARANAADATPTDGLLHGVPFVIKDIIDTDDMPTCWGSPIYQRRQPRQNADCVQRFIAAGAVPVGKTVTTEFAFFRPSKTANPHNLAHTPGGSSSGSAAAVADYMAPIGFGSQTVASLIRPAAYCGVSAFKPTTCCYDLTGVMSLSHSLDTLGTLARDPRDHLLMHQVLRGVYAGPEPDFCDTLPRIGLMRGPHWWDGEIAMRDVCTRALAAIACTGADTCELVHPQVFEELTKAQITVMGYESARIRACEYDQYHDQISPQFAALIQAGREVSDEQYSVALKIRDQAKIRLELLFADVDAFLVPSAPGPAPEGLDSTGDPLFSRIWNLLQLPCVALPFGTDQNGLPLGVQLIGRRDSDEVLLHIAHWVAGVLDDKK